MNECVENNLGKLVKHHQDPPPTPTHPKILTQELGRGHTNLPFKQVPGGILVTMTHRLSSEKPSDRAVDFSDRR